MDAEPPYIASDENALFQAYCALRDMGTSSAVSTLLFDGPPGIGKTRLGRHLASVLEGQMLRFQFYAGCGRKELLFDEQFATEENPRGEGILPRAIHLSKSDKPVVLLMDEIDKADRAVDGFLLNFLSEGFIAMPQGGDLVANTENLLVYITKNDDRSVSSPLLRRCRVVYMDWPTLEIETEIVLSTHPWLTPTAIEVLLNPIHRLRKNPEIIKPPSTPEVIRLAYDLADFMRFSLNPGQVGKLYRNSIAQNPTDRRFIEKSDYYLGSILIEAFKELKAPQPDQKRLEIASKLF